MNIWMINHYALPPDQQGGTRHFILARELVKRGHQVTIFACPFHFQQYQYYRETSQRSDEVIDGVHFSWVPARAYQGNGVGRVLNMLDYRRNLGKIMQGKARPDIVFASTPHPFAPLRAMGYARKNRLPFVLEVRDLWPQSFYDLDILPKWHPLCVGFALIQQLLHRRAAHIVTLLNNSPSYIRDHGGRGKPITVLPNMIDMRDIPPVKTARQIGQSFTIIYAGAHGPANDLDSLLNVAQTLQQDHQDKDIQFICIGSGSERERLIAQAIQRGVKNITFRPSVSKAQIYQEMQQADAFIMQLRPSPVFQWGISPNKLFDYMAMARPTILCVDAPNNALERSGGGLICPAGDIGAITHAVLDLYAMPKQARDDMGQKAYDYVAKHHNLIQGVDTLEHIFQTVKGGT